MKIDKKLNSYIDAGYPIIYINSFEEMKVDGIISSVMGGRKGLEWNRSQGFCDFKTKQALIADNGLPETLKLLCADNELGIAYITVHNKNRISKCHKNGGLVCLYCIVGIGVAYNAVFSFKCMLPYLRIISIGR